jgi:DNA-binding SARP family transcriptional activator
MTGRWRIELFDGLRLRRVGPGEGAEEVPAITHFESRRVALLLAYLAFYPERVHSREALAGALWPDEGAEATRERFRHALSMLRRLLEPQETPAGSVLESDRLQVRLRPEAIVTDVAEFEACRRRARSAGSPGEQLRSLREAVETYRGELLPGFYEEWVLGERERFAQEYRDALSCAASSAAAAGDAALAIDFARRAVAADPLAEDAHRLLLRLYAAADRVPEAIRHFRDLERLLRDEVGGSPSQATRALFQEITAAAPADPAPPAAPGRLRMSLPPLEPEGGAVSLGSPFYLERPTDAAFMTALARGDSIVLVKGARQIGKTSLLARGLDASRRAGARIVSTDLQKFTGEQMETADALFFTVAAEIAEQLELDLSLEEVWNPRRGWNVNFERFLRREVLGRGEAPIVWGLDETDRLFGLPFSGEVFGLFRSWHNQRSMDPEGPWRRFTMAIAYATEAHLFVRDLNQSPFNVGTRLALDDFTPGEVAEMNHRYGAGGAPPLRDMAEVRRFHTLVGGHPYLVRRGLHAMSEEGLDLADLERRAEGDGGCFADHLRRLLGALRHDAELLEALRSFLEVKGRLSPEAFYRLRSAGVVAGRFEGEARLRCRVYDTFFTRYLR